VQLQLIHLALVLLHLPPALLLVRVHLSHCPSTWLFPCCFGCSCGCLEEEDEVGISSPAAAFEFGRTGI
jgi:hypothetical protein